MAIPHGKATLQMHEANLMALLDIQSCFTNFRNLPDLKIEDDAYSSKLYRDMKAAGYAPILQSLRFINQQVDILTGEIRTLLDHIKSLDFKLQGWKSSLQLSQTSLQTLTACITQTEATIDAAAAAFRPFLRFPAEIWQTIFQIVVHDEMEDYLKSNNQNPLRSAALVLAHTCHLWRNLVYRDATLWRVITIHASQYWPRPRHFNGVRSLTIVNDYPKFVFSTTINLATILPQLTALTYKVKQFPARFELFSFLPSALEELYVYHNTGDFPIGTSSPFELSKLHSLGLTGL
ncbi:hypothetical protein FRC17_000749, partial [Serendipita sp. 399]